MRKDVTRSARLGKPRRKTVNNRYRCPTIQPRTSGLREASNLS
ncbi:MAG: hypothetical protein ACJ8AI_30555 [Rhodopila sp.]|jgi:hypothetical protein